MTAPLREPALVAKSKGATALLLRPNATLRPTQHIAPHTPCDVFETSDADWVMVRPRVGNAIGQTGYARRGHFGSLRLPSRLPPLPFRVGMGHVTPTTPATLFNGSGRPEPQDIRQGLLGDCSLLAAFGAVARRYTHFLRQSFVDFGAEENVTVRYFEADERGLARKRSLAVSHRILRAASPFENVAIGARLRRDAQQSAAWPAILEKAYALSTGDGGYAHINGHDAKHVFAWLLGCSAETFAFRNRWRDATANLADLAARYDAGECLVVYSAKHAYEVVGFSGAGKNRRCRLYSSQGLWPGARGGRVVVYGRKRFALNVVAFTATHGAGEAIQRESGRCVADEP